MRVGDIAVRKSRIDWMIESARYRGNLFIEVSDDLELSQRGEPLLTSALLPAMRAGEDLHVDGPVDTSLLEHVETIQDIVLSWDLELRPTSPRYNRTSIDAAEKTGAHPDDAVRRTGCFFTGGLDSFYSAVKNRDRIDALIYVHGFDVKLHDSLLYGSVVSHLRAAADNLGLPLILLRTNVRSFFDEHRAAHWEDTHGSALATIAHALAPHFERILIPSSWSYAHLEPWGSHPLLDPLWSSSGVELVYDGGEANRLSKFRLIADSPAAREHLRVCWENPGGSYNCGRCEKCVRTALCAEICGVSEAFEALPAVDPKAAARVQAGHAWISWADMLRTLERSGERPDIQQTLRRVIRRSRVFEKIESRTGDSRAMWALSHPRQAVRRITTDRRRPSHR